MQVGHVDGVAIAQAERADAGRSQVQQGGRSQAAGPHYEDGGVAQFFLGCRRVLMGRVGWWEGGVWAGRWDGGAAGATDPATDSHQ